MASNLNISDLIFETETHNSSHYFGRHEFITSKTEVALPCLVVLILATIVGTLGNILILLCVLTSKSLRKVEGIFIVNLAASDLYVTLVADPMSIVGKLEGEAFFSRIPGLCQTVASLCTVSCVTSLMTIAAMSCNRYIYICAHDKYEKVFTTRNCIWICISFYLVGGIFVLLNVADIGDHGFDRKSLECIWDRMATYPYTVIFSVTLVWIPSTVTGICYLRIFMYVRRHRKRIREQNQSANSALFQKRFHLARTLFIIYVVFVTCWVPYALLIVVDYTDSFTHEIHVYITTFAHLHPSLNWLIYLTTNKKFVDACKRLLTKCRVCRFDITEVASSVGHSRILPYSKSKRDETTVDGQGEANGYPGTHQFAANKPEMRHDENFGNTQNHSKVIESSC